MKPGVPWSIKGVEPGLREAAKIAARRSGLTLGEWLNSAINEQADAYDDMPKESPRGRARTPHVMERAASKLEDIAEKLARLQPETEGSYRAVPQLDSQVNFAKILSRVEAHEKLTSENFGAIGERLDTISKQITRHAPPKFEETPSYLALEKAVRNIIEHLDVSDKRTRENMKTLQERIGEMSTRITGSDQLLRQAPAFSALESRLAELVRKVEQPVQNPGDMLRSEIEQLATRIDSVRESSEQLANRAQTQAVQTAQGELRAIEGRLINLLNEAKQSIMANHVGPAELQRFRGEIDKLHSRIDEAQKHAASDRDVSALKVAIEQLSSRVAQGHDQKPIADLDRRILEIAQKLERAEQQGLGGTMMSEVERRFAELDQRLSQGHAPSDTGKMREMDDRLARTEQQLTHLDTIERAIAQLYEAFEENRKNPQAATAAATGDKAVPATGLSTSPEIVALENGLKAVREAAEKADQHNQETLEAVHGTLEQIVTKLAELETVAIGQRVGAAVAPPVVENPFALKEEPQGRNPFVAPEPEMKAEPKLADEPSFDNNPFEAAAPAPAASTDSGISDLIAAARRLHQQNNSQPGQLSNFAPGKAKARGKDKQKSGKGFSLPFLSSSEGKTLKSVTQAAANGNEAGSKRRLVFLGILLLAVATFATTNMLSRSHQPKPAQPAAIEQPATPPAAVAPAPIDTPAPPAADPQPKQSGPIQMTPAAPTPPAAAAGQVPPLADPAPAPLANPDQQSNAADPMLTDPITTGSTTAPKAAGGISALDAAVGPAKLRDAATSGDKTAQFIVATHYLNGDTTGQNYNKAVYWYGKAAASGSAPAQYRLATMYERGTGVQKNMSTALKWYEQAGSAGNVKSMHNAAVIAAGSDAGGPDYARAFKWFGLAANHGLKDSEFNLAVLLERGLGTKQDTAQALFWYMAAAAQDDADAKARVEVISKTMDQADVDAVAQRFKGWSPQKASDAANVVAVDDSQWNPSSSTTKAPINKQSMAENPNDRAKRLLDQMGYRVGSLDGTLDAKTANAIKLFQIKEGLKATGRVTPDLLDKMQDSVG